MIKYYCDRCGSEITLEGVDYPHTIIIWSGIVDINDTQCKMPEDIKILCKECIDEYKQYIKDGYNNE